MKKTLALVLTLMLAAGAFAACGGNKNNDGSNSNDVESSQTENEAGKQEAVDTSKYTLQGIVDSIYAVKAPMFMYGSMPVDLEDEFSYKTYLGLDDPSVIKEAVVSESMIGAQAYSLVIARVAEGQDAAAVAESMKAGIDTRKWVCVEADDVNTATYGDLVCFIMISSEYKDALTAKEITDAFTKIMNGEAKYEEGAAPNIPEMPAEDLEREEGEDVDGEAAGNEAVDAGNQPATMPEENGTAADNTPAVAPEENGDAEADAPAAAPEENVPAEGEAETDAPADSEANAVSETEAIVNAIYEHKMPQFMLGTMPVDLTDEFSYKTYLGLDDPSVISEAVFSESMIGAQAYSLVVAKVAEGQDAAAVAEDMKAGIDPRKWICVEADDVKVKAIGNYICFCMIDSEFASDFTAQDAMDGFTKAVEA